MPFPRPDNMVEIVAESWMFIDKAIRGRATIRTETVGHRLASLMDFICEKHPSTRAPKYVNIRDIISDYVNKHAESSAHVNIKTEIEWYLLLSTHLLNH